MHGSYAVSLPTVDTIPVGPPLTRGIEQRPMVGSGCGLLLAFPEARQTVGEGLTASSGACAQGWICRAQTSAAAGP